MRSAWRIPEPCWVAFLAGLFLIHQGERSFSEDFGPSVLLFGENLVTSLGAIYFCGSIVAIFMVWLARRGADRIVLALFALSSLASLHYFHISYNFTYTNDLQGHLDYAYFMHKHPGRPGSYNGWENFQPPLYYYLAALAIKMAQDFHTVPVLTAIRFVSWVCMLVFQFFGVLTLRRLSWSQQAGWLASALFLLWPGNIHIAARISNEALYYAFFSAGFYYLILWYQDNRPKPLVTAAAFTALSIATRTNGVMLAATAALHVAIKWVRRDFSLRFLSKTQWILLVGFCLLGIGLNTIHMLLNPSGGFNAHMGTGGSGGIPLMNFISMNLQEYINSPLYNSGRVQTYWSILFKTSMYGEYHWDGSMLLLRLMNATLLLLVTYALLPWLSGRWQKWREMLPFMTMMAIAMLFHMEFASLKFYLLCQDMRYIYPVLIGFSALYGHSYDTARRHHDQPLTLLGTGLVVAFTIMGLLLFWDNVRFAAS